MPELLVDPLPEALVRQYLAKILASPEFVHAARSSRFLQFVVDQSLQGTAADLKEYVIAVEVFGRKESYDSREHSAVRVEAARLRQRLRSYYESGGREDPLTIELPKGKYVPVFLPRRAAAAPPEILAETSRGSKWWLFALPASLVVVALGWSAFRKVPSEPSFQYRALTETPGRESAPSISPAGDLVAYEKRAGGVSHIFLERTLENAKDPHPEDLTAGSGADNTQPAFSPDGGRIAFRSERDGGGIFILDLKSRRLERISNFCFNPAWSSDGGAIACASEMVLRPEQRLGPKSSLWTIDVASHRTQQIYAGDAVQPSWSPNGKRIAFWMSDEGGARDIWTIAPDGSSPTPVTNDPSLDWCPRWSPDGKWLYFLSDRNGSMNLWRVRIDPQTGAPEGTVEPQTTPAIDMSLFSFARSTPMMIYENRIILGKVVRIDWRTGATRTVTEMPAARQPVGPDVSGDGKWLTFYTIGKSEEIYVVGTDGSNLRRLVSGDFRSRGPRWGPDGKTIAFQSTKSGRPEIWTIQSDGSGLRQITSGGAAEPIQPVWAPDGKSLAYSRTDGTSAIVKLSATAAGEPEILPANGFLVRSWSLDGRKILGQQASANGAVAMMLEYDVRTGQIRELGPGNEDIWDLDSRHILYERDGDVWRMDTVTGKSEELARIAPNRLAGVRRSPEGDILYAGISTIDSDLWVRMTHR
jgi:Tol biopolymer transport system component